MFSLFQKAGKNYQNKSHYMICITCISLNSVAVLFKQKSTSALQHGVTETLVLTVACLLIINPLTAENSDVRPAWKDSLHRFSSFSLFLVGEKSARRPWLHRMRVVARLVFVGCSCGSDHVADEVWLLHWISEAECLSWWEDSDRRMVSSPALLLFAWGETRRRSLNASNSRGPTRQAFHRGCGMVLSFCWYTELRYVPIATLSKCCGLGKSCFAFWHFIP